MKIASKELVNELYKLENEYFKLMKVSANETARCKLQGELVKGFVKSPEIVEEAIEKLKIKIENAKKELDKKEKAKSKLPAGVIEAKFRGYDAETGEIIEVGDWIARVPNGWAKIENAF